MTTGAQDGRSGGTFTSPARPDNFTPSDSDGRGSPDSFVGEHTPDSNCDALGTKDGDLKPLGFENKNLDNRYSFPSVINLDDNDGDAY